jgi:hypothetical protein
MKDSARRFNTVQSTGKDSSAQRKTVQDTVNNFETLKVMQESERKCKKVHPRTRKVETQVRNIAKCTER